MANIGAAILAGGKSIRMGEDKAELRLNGKTLLDQMRYILSSTNISDIFISRSDYIKDEISGFGPLSGIHAILKHTLENYDHIIFVPIDMPQLTPALINKLIQAPNNADLVHFQSYRLPFRLSAKQRWTELAQAILLENKNVSLGAFYDNFQNKHLIDLHSNEHQSFININTPQQWKTLSAKKPQRNFDE